VKIGNFTAAGTFRAAFTSSREPLSDFFFQMNERWRERQGTGGGSLNPSLRNPAYGGAIVTDQILIQMGFISTVKTSVNDALIP